MNENWIIDRRVRIERVTFTPLLTFTFSRRKKNLLRISKRNMSACRQFQGQLVKFRSLLQRLWSKLGYLGNSNQSAEKSTAILAERQSWFHQCACGSLINKLPLLARRVFISWKKKHRNPLHAFRSYFWHFPKWRFHQKLAPSEIHFTEVKLKFTFKS